MIFRCDRPGAATPGRVVSGPRREAVQPLEGDGGRPAGGGGDRPRGATSAGGGPAPMTLVAGGSCGTRPSTRPSRHSICHLQAKWAGFTATRKPPRGTRSAKGASLDLGASVPQSLRIGLVSTISRAELMPAPGPATSPPARTRAPQEDPRRSSSSCGPLFAPRTWCGSTPGRSRAAGALERCGSLVELGVTEQVGVDGGGDVGVRVPELARDDDQRHAPREHHACARVSKAVRRHQRRWPTVPLVPQPGRHASAHARGHVRVSGRASDRRPDLATRTRRQSRRR